MKKSFLVLALAMFLTSRGWSAPASFAQLCADPATAAEQKKTFRILLDIALSGFPEFSLPASLPPATVENCRAAESKLIVVKKLWLRSPTRKIGPHHETQTLYPIRDLSALVYLTGLEELRVDTATSDISPLVSLAKLRKLTISPESDNAAAFRPDAPVILASLEKMTQLEALQIRLLGISDINPLSRLEKLRVLNLSTNAVSNLSALSRLTSLETLDLSWNKVESLEGIGAHPNLASLILDSNPLKSLDGLEGMAHLITLSARPAVPPRPVIRFSDIRALGGLVEMQSLDLEGQAISDLGPLSRMVRLKKLNLPRNQVTSIEPLRDLVAMETLELNSNKIAELTPLAAMSALRTLSVARNKIQSLEGLEGKTALNWLGISYNQVKSIQPLAGCMKLQALNANNNPVQSVEPLAGHIDLTSLHIEGTEVENLTPIGPLRKPHLNSYGQMVKLFVYID